MPPNGISYPDQKRDRQKGEFSFESSSSSVATHDEVGLGETSTFGTFMITLEVRKCGVATTIWTKSVTTSK